MIYFIIYILGLLPAFGLAVGIQYMTDIKYVKHLQPTFLKPWHDPLALIVSGLSWLGVIVLISVQLSKYKKVVFKYSYKDLWERWNNTSSK